MIGGGKRQGSRGQTDTRGCPGVGGFSASLSEEMSSASPNRSSAAADVFATQRNERHFKNLIRQLIMLKENQIWIVYLTLNNAQSINL